MMERPTEEDAQANLETWVIAPSGNYRDTLSWLAVLSTRDYPLYLDQVATLAEVPQQALDKEVQQRRRVLAGTYPASGGHAPAPPHASPGMQPSPVFAPAYGAPHSFISTPSMALVPMAQGQLAVYTCYGCGTTAPPMMRTRVSTGGWILFAILFLSCFVLSFIPLVTMRESFPACGRCRRQLT